MWTQFDADQHDPKQIDPDQVPSWGERLKDYKKDYKKISLILVGSYNKRV